MAMPLTSASTVKVAVGQMTSTANKLQNFQVCSGLIQEAVAAGATFLALPECFNFIGNHWTETINAAEPLTGPSIARFQKLARDSGLWLSLGGFQEEVLGDDAVNAGDRGEKSKEPSNQSGGRANKVYNSHVIISGTGKIEATYRKIHLFDVDIPGGAVLKESRYTEAGTDMVVCRGTPVGDIGMTTCYDLRFPEMYACLAEKGSQMMLVPSAFTVPTGQAHWEVLLRARAIETQCFVIAAAQVGNHNEKRASYGHSLIVDPWGRVLADAGGEDAPCIRTAEIDLSELTALRQKMPIHEHRKAAGPMFAQQLFGDVFQGKSVL